MCGHVGVAGYLGQKDEAFFKEALWADTLRGSHNTGAALVRGKKTLLTKVSGPTQFLLSNKEFEANATHWNRVMIGHNRHATVGDRTSANAHPFEFDRIVGAHNGTLDMDAQRRLKDRDKYGTDSEALYANINEFGIEAVIPEMRGAWALVMWDKEKETLTFLRNNQREFSYTMSEDGRTIYWASEHKMLEWILHRNKIKHGTVYVTNPDVLIEFSIPDGWNKKIEEVRTLELKGKAYTPSKNLPTFVPTAANEWDDNEPWDLADVLEGWTPQKGTSPKKQSDNVKLLSGPVAKPGSLGGKAEANLMSLQPSTRKRMLDRAWDEGFAAGDGGKSITQCPYKNNKYLMDEWKQGHKTALYDRQAKTGEKTPVADESVVCRDYKGFPMTEGDFAAATDNLCAWGDHVLEYNDEFRWFDASTCVCTDCIEQNNEVAQLFERYS